MGKKSKSKKSSAYPDLSKKVPDNCVASASHMFGTDVSVHYLDGDRPADETMAVEMAVVSASGLQFNRNYRGKDNLIGMPASTVIRVNRRLGKGKGESFDEIPWPKSSAAWAEEHVGERVYLRYTDGGRTKVIKHALIGCVDEAGIGFAFSAYGQEHLGWMPLSSLVDMTIQLVDEDDDEDGDEEDED